MILDISARSDASVCKACTQVGCIIHFSFITVNTSTQVWAIQLFQKRFYLVHNSLLLITHRFQRGWLAAAVWLRLSRGICIQEAPSGSPSILEEPGVKSNVTRQTYLCSKYVSVYTTDRQKPPISPQYDSLRQLCQSIVIPIFMPIR